MKLGIAGLGALAIPKINEVNAYLPEFPDYQRLGRTFYTVDIKSKPDPDSATVETVFEDHVLPILREVIGQPYNY